MVAKLKDQELQMGIRDRKLARLIVQISTLQGELRAKATELRSSRTKLISQRQYIQEIIDKSQILRAENLEMKGELQEVERLKKENGKQKERIVELTGYYKERGHLIQRLHTAQKSNKLLQQMLQKTVSISTQCFPNPPSFSPTTPKSPPNMPSSFFSNMNSSLNKPLDPTASSFQTNLNPNARTFLPSDLSSREDRERTEEKVPQISLDDAGTTEKAKEIENASSAGSLTTEKERRVERRSSSPKFKGDQRREKDKQFRLEMRQKIAEAVHIRELQSSDCFNYPIVNTRFAIKSPKKGEFCWVNVEFDVTNPIHSNSLPEEILFHPSFHPDYQGKDLKPPSLPMDGNWDQWLQKAMDSEIKLSPQQDQSKRKEQMTSPPMKNDILVKAESTKQHQLPCQQDYKEDLSKVEIPREEEELASVPGSSKNSSPSKPSEYLDFSIGIKTTGTLEREAKNEQLAPHADNCSEESLEEGCAERKQTSPEEVEKSLKPAKAPDNLSDGFLEFGKKRVSEEVSEAQNDKDTPTVTQRQLVKRPIQHQEVVQKSMSEPIAEALALVPGDELTDTSKPICQEAKGSSATPATTISGLETTTKQGNTTHALLSSSLKRDLYKWKTSQRNKELR